MESYKVAAVTLNRDGWLNIWSRNCVPVPVAIPDSYHDILKPGMRVVVHRNRRGAAVAYSFGGFMYFAVLPVTRSAATDFMKNFKDIYRGSLDSVIFKYELNKALKNMGLTPTASAVTNIILFHEAHRTYQVQR